MYVNGVPLTEINGETLGAGLSGLGRACADGCGGGPHCIIFADDERNEDRFPTQHPPFVGFCYVGINVLVKWGSSISHHREGAGYSGSTLTATLPQAD